MARHPFARLLDGLDLPITGPVPDDDPVYGRAYRTVDMLAGVAEQIRDEVWFTAVATTAAGAVHLTLDGAPVATVRLSSPHADAHLVVADPPKETP